MTLMKKFLGATAALALTAGVAAAEPALIFDLGGKFDKSFNEAAYNGAQKWAKEAGGTYKELEMQSAAQRVQFARRMAESGANPIVVMGFQNEETLKEVAPDYPDTSFVLIDAVVDLPNVRSVIFAEHEGSYLVGMLGALASKSGTISFVGGMDIPLISAFACGYAQGAKAVNPDIKVIVNYTGDTPAAWNDPVKGGEIAKAQMSQGSDVIFAAAGGTGLGVLQAAADAGKLSIGVDFEPEPPAFRQGADLDAEAGGQRRLRGVQGRPGPETRRGQDGSGRRWRRLCAGRPQQGSDHRRHEGQGRCGAGRYRGRQDQGA